MHRGPAAYGGLVLPPGTHCYRVLDDGVCELDRGHDGDHLPYVPGEYLPLSLITPLHILALTWRNPRLTCPLCGTPSTSISCNEAGVIFREFEGRGSVEGEWCFEPCGCTGREIITADATECDLILTTEP